MAFEKLFTPIKIPDLELKNRVVMSATGTYESSLTEDGKVIVACEGDVKELEADIVIMAVGSRSNDISALEAKCNELNIPYYIVGDASAPKLAINAIHDAYKAVLAINQ